MATKTITSGENKTKVGTTGTELYTKTRVTYTTDENGKINSNTVKTEILYQQVPGDPPVVAATKTGTDKDFTITKNEFTGKEYFGADAQKSLKQGALRTTTNQQIDSAMKKEGLTAEQKQSIKASSTAASPPSPDEFKLEDATKGAEALSALSIGDGDIRENYNDGKPLQYPLNFPEKQDRIKFTMYRYAPKKFGIGANFEKLNAFSGSNIAVDKDNEKRIFGSVFLPISPSITDTNTVNWGSDEMTALQALAAGAAYASIKDGVMGAEMVASAVAKGLSGEGVSANLKAAAATYFAGEAAGGNKNFFSRVTGAVLNPNMELLFNGPQLRTFSFSFTLSAREEKESKEIRKIIRFFKQGMSVKRASTNLFLKAPNIFDISYLYGGDSQEHPWINKIKTCALTSCQVNYTPAGNYATYYDGSMTSYELTLSFSEIDPIFEDDYKALDKNNDTTIGY